MDRKRVSKRVMEKNHISEDREYLYKVALLREYSSFSKAQWLLKKSHKNKNKGKYKNNAGFFKKIFRTKSTDMNK